VQYQANRNHCSKFQPPMVYAWLYYFSLSNELHNIICLRHSDKHIACIIVATTLFIHYDYKISHKHIQPKTHHLISFTAFIRQIENNKFFISDRSFLLFFFFFFFYFFFFLQQRTYKKPPNNSCERRFQPSTKKKNKFPNQKHKCSFAL
jgi:hypothetical protein